jgi:hypothetical protein
MYLCTATWTNQLDSSGYLDAHHMDSLQSLQLYALRWMSRQRFTEGHRLHAEPEICQRLCPAGLRARTHQTVVALYFASSSCVFCRSFSKTLAGAYAEAPRIGIGFEIIEVRSMRRMLTRGR